MPWLRCSRLAKAALVAVLLAAWSVAACAQETPIGEPIYLEVFVNGQRAGLIANVVLRPDRRIAITVAELRELRIKPDRLPVDPNGLIDLDRCSGLSYRYDEIRQTIRIDIGDPGRIPFVVDTRVHRSARPTDTD